MRGLSSVFAMVWLGLAHWPLATHGDYSVDDAQLFKINFNSFASPDDSTGATGATGATATTATTPQDPSGADQAPVETLIVRSQWQEEYECQIPRTRAKAGSKFQDPLAEGANALELLQELFLQKTCAYRLEHYWTYELCHGRHVRQFHEERDGKNVKTTEYFLGRYNAEQYDLELKELKRDIEAGQARKPPKIKIETMNMPYFQLHMTDGTLCDLNGRPRQTRVNYVCYPAGHHEMYSFKESSTCEYDIIVLSPTLCQHLDYRPEESNEYSIECKPRNSKTPYKPRDLIQLEADSLKLRSEKMFEGDFMQGNNGPGSVKIEIKPVKTSGVADISDEDLDDETVAYKDDNWPQPAPRAPFKPLMDPKVVQEFLLGDYCLYGGSGWWKYEFCYGKSVDQYHEERKGDRTLINLGRFDMAKHLAWLKDNPNKRPKPVSERKQVSHLYSDGDLCDLTGKPRRVEVKLKCKKSDSPSTVSLYLLEPKTCDYILGVESPIVCDILHLADQDGMMVIEKDVFVREDPKSGNHEDDSPRVEPPPSVETTIDFNDYDDESIEAEEKSLSDEPKDEL
ncbi:hypothetical protein TCAL_01386 [Tigriopus californicus]|uniref:Endoplasmic reticulum lectin 1 n=1 Tax=Tigriopus californicus TaxID=6832 RepID=A0A553NSS2_TIGCA|nr:hypothetical protein TCAL_01386 [Tigriopus californicus]|eukprot:TCALIF_01386-PA protein Name:"Similar to ERLEC1 Endoplasmic reticulum lectin 1 (Homo sapiens)" AED:0.05 eAED:0.05 QI:170/1/1/1/1/1/7/236/567